MAEVDRFADIIRDSPGLSQNEVVKRAGIKRERAIGLLKRNEGSLWCSQEGANRSKSYFPIQMVPKAVLSGSSGTICKVVPKTAPSLVPADGNHSASLKWFLVSHPLEVGTVNN